MSKAKLLNGVLAGALVGLFAASGAGYAGETVGPGGEKATPSSALTLSDSEVAKLKGGKYTAALLWHTSSDFTNAVTAGATDEFKRGGIGIAVTTDAQFDAARQRSELVSLLRR